MSIRLCNHRALVIDNLPTIRRAPPDTGAPRPAFLALDKGIRDQIHVGRQFANVRIRGFANGVSSCRLTPFEDIQHVFSGITPSGRTHFAEIGSNHMLEIATRFFNIARMERKFSCHQLIENFAQ